MSCRNLSFIERKTAVRRKFFDGNNKKRPPLAAESKKYDIIIVQKQKRKTRQTKAAIGQRIFGAAARIAATAKVLSAEGKGAILYIDLLGKKRMKVGLHIHTTRSDGHKSPEQAAEIYRKAGYDLIALTDHWVISEEKEISGLRTISGCEFNIGGNDTKKGVFHIVGLGMQKDPCLTQKDDAQMIIDGIKAVGGIAVLAHPACSLNSVEQIKTIHVF